MPNIPEKIEALYYERIADINDHLSGLESSVTDLLNQYMQQYKENEDPIDLEIATRFASAKATLQIFKHDMKL